MNKDQKIVKGKSFLAERGGGVEQAFQLMKYTIQPPLLAHLQAIGENKEMRENMEDVLLLMSIKSRMNNKGDEYSLALQDFGALIAGLGALVEKNSLQKKEE